MSDMYDWVTGTWNPLAGQCPHDCCYCYVKRLKRRFPAMRDRYSGPQRVDIPKTPPPKGTVFLCSCNDLFTWDTSGGIIAKVLDAASLYQRRWVVQTKNPGRIPDELARRLSDMGASVGATIESDGPWFLSNAPCPANRMDEMARLGSLGLDTFITIEPILMFGDDFSRHLLETGVRRFYIGADTGRNHFIEPTGQEVSRLVSDLRASGAEVSVKSNLKRIWEGA